MSRRKSTKNLIQNLSNLDHATAHKVLIELAEQCPEVEPILSVIVEEATSDNSLEYLSTTIEQVIGKAFAESEPRPRRRRGHEEESDEVSNVIIEALGPYVERLEKLLVKGNDPVALNLGLAIILALYRAKSSDAVRAFARDFSFEEIEEEFEGAADWVARLWRAEGNVDNAGVRRFVPGRDIPAEFVHEYVAEWDWLLSDD